MSFQALEAAIGINEGKSRTYRAYFRSRQTLRNTPVMAPPELRNDYFTSIPFCRLACQVLSERIEMDSVTALSQDTGTRDEAATKYLRRILTMLGGADFVNSAHLAAMEFGRSYLVPTGTDREDGLPGVQLVPGQDMVHSVDPFTGEIREALRVFGRGRNQRAYYTKDFTYYLTPGPGVNGVVDMYVVDSQVPTVNGEIAVFPLMCRGEITNPWGRPEAKDVFRLQDSACRMATDLSIASATMATPQRVLFGVEEEDFAPKDYQGNAALDGNGNPLPGPTAEQLYMSRLLTISDPAAKLAEFVAAQLQNFTTGLNTITRQAAAVLGIPQSVFGVASDANPSSGSAMRQDDARLIRRAEQLTRGFEPGWLGLFQYLADAANFTVDVGIRWVDPSLPNRAALTDSVIKLAATMVDGQPLYDWEDLRRMLGDSEPEIEAAKARREVNQIRNLISNPNPGNGTGP